MEPLPEAPVPLPNEAPHLLERLAAGTPGIRITSSVQYSLQKQTQELVNRYAREYSSSNHIHNLAALIADVETGEILAYAGNATFQADEKRGNQVDIITSPRSTGSILKTFPLCRHAARRTDTPFHPRIGCTSEHQRFYAAEL